MSDKSKCVICGRALGFQDGEWYDVDGLTYAPDQSHAHVPMLAREEVMADGTKRFTDDPWQDVDTDVRMEQDNGYVAETWADVYDSDDYD